MVAIVSVEDYSLIGLGETKEEAYRNYKEVLESEGNDIELDENEDLEQIEGIISRINQDVKSGDTTYYITLKDNDQLIFTGTSKVSTELPITMVGDQVSISYVKTDSNTISIAEFDNNNIGKTEKSSEKEEDNKNKDNEEKTE